MSEQIGYFAVITADVLFNDELSDSEKIIMAHISVLQRKDGWCIASNSYFGKVMNCHKNTAGKYINKLKKLGLLDVHVVYENNSKQVKKRLIRGAVKQSKIDTPINGNVETPINGNVEPPINAMVEDNNTRSNNTSINIKENKQRKVYKKINLENLDNNISMQAAKDFIDHRQVLRKPLTQRAFELSMKQAMQGYQINLTPDQVINNTIANGWQGININWIRNQQRTQTKERPLSFEQQRHDKNKKVVDDWLEDSGGGKCLIETKRISQF